MGTRYLTCVVLGGEFIVAQYGQWDGYPERAGTHILNFLKEVDMEVFKRKLTLLRFTTDEDNKVVDDFLKEIKSKDGWMNTEQSKLYKNEFPLLSRDVGSVILEAIVEAEHTNFITHSLDFAEDSLFCEWVYIIDLDKGKLEVYKGFNTDILSESERFFYLQEDTSKEYKPVKFKKDFNLNNLPTEEEFLEILK